MRIAIAGAGDLAKYLVEESLAASHEVVVISRSTKPWFERKDITFRVTDYSVPSLVEVLNDCDGLVSSILDYSMANVTAHLALLEACKQTPTCKRYIPSEYAGNVDDYPEQPTFYHANHHPVRKALAEQKEVMGTLFNVGWLSDYIVPPSSRHLKDIGPFHPIDYTTNTFTIPGTGDEPVCFTAARDAAKAIARLMSHDNWDATTYVSGETTTWNELAKMLPRRGKTLKVVHKPRAVLEQEIASAESEDQVLAAQYGMWSVSGAGLLPEEKLRLQYKKYFEGITFRTVEQLLDDAEKDKNLIV